MTVDGRVDDRSSEADDGRDGGPSGATERFDWVGRPAPPPEGCFVGVATGDLVERARRLEYEVFVEQGYCDPSPVSRIAEYGPWEHRSQFHVVVSPADELMAAVRTTIGSYDSLPVGSFRRDDEYPAGEVLEFASLVAPRSARGAGGVEALFQSVLQDTILRGLDGLVAIGEQWLLDLLNDVYDFRFRQLGPSRWYMGGECFPMGTSMRDLLRHLSANQPTLLDWFLDGLDLRDGSRPAPLPHGAPEAPRAQPEQVGPAPLPVAGA
jgi:hypothetical protein